MNQYISIKLKILSFIAIILVVFLHSYNLTINLGNGSFATDNSAVIFIENFISQGITRVAVPLFFMISGYLFFVNIKSGVWSEFKLKYKKRFHSLVVPYLLWSLLWLAILFVLQQIPYTANFFANKMVYEYTWRELLNTVFLNPIPYQFWFIRDLIVLVFFTPLIYNVLEKNSILGKVLLVLFSLNWLYPVIATPFVQNESLLFFIVGSFWAINKKPLQSEKLLRIAIPLFILWILLNILISYCILCQIHYYPFPLRQLSILTGVVSIWGLYDYTMKGRQNIAAPYFMTFTFFVFAAHEPLLKIVTKLCMKMFDWSDVGYIITYLGAPIITIIFAIIVGGMMKRYFPNFFSILTGKR